VSVGPSGFTAAGFIHLGNLLFSKVLPNGFLGYQDAAVVLKVVLSLVGLWLWGLCIWFFFVSVGAHWEIIWPRGPRHRIHFDMTWSVPSQFWRNEASAIIFTLTFESRYSFVFPNTALVSQDGDLSCKDDAYRIQVTATQEIGKTFHSPAIQIVGTVMAGLLVAIWLCVFIMMIRALVLRRLLWPVENTAEDDIARRNDDSENDEITRRQNSTQKPAAT
jgi:tellurite resistance protein TehA-like permease